MLSYYNLHWKEEELLNTEFKKLLQKATNTKVLKRAVAVLEKVEFMSV